MNSDKKIFLIVVLLSGLVVPFIHTIIIIEVFVLLIPFALIFAATLIYLVLSLFFKKMDTKLAIFAFSIIPIFILAQLLSSFSVDKIQRFRSENIIAELNQIKAETGTLPEQYDLLAGIEYKRLNDNKHFLIKYSSGFLVTNKFYSQNGNWKSYGWND